jgi:hypothetical protein
MILFGSQVITLDTNYLSEQIGCHARHQLSFKVDPPGDGEAVAGSRPQSGVPRPVARRLIAQAPQPGLDFHGLP